MLYTKKSGAHLRIIDGGSGYLCEMEPVAHFGLGESGPGAGGNELLHPDGGFLKMRPDTRSVTDDSQPQQLPGARYFQVW